MLRGTYPYRGGAVGIVDRLAAEAILVPPSAHETLCCERNVQSCLHIFVIGAFPGLEIEHCSRRESGSVVGKLLFIQGALLSRECPGKSFVINKAIRVLGEILTFIYLLFYRIMPLYAH